MKKCACKQELDRYCHYIPLLSLTKRSNVYFQLSLFLRQILPVNSCSQWHNNETVFSPVSTLLLINSRAVHFSYELLYLEWRLATVAFVMSTVCPLRVRKNRKWLVSEITNMDLTEISKHESVTVPMQRTSQTLARATIIVLRLY
jgi:hypothetical protein